MQGTHGDEGSLYGSRQLSGRDMRIVGMVARGLRNQDIAARLGTTVDMVKSYLRVIYDKTGMNSRLELALWFMAQKEKTHDDKGKGNSRTH